MGNSLKDWLKRISPLALSKNHFYDRLAVKILRKYCRIDSNCIDIGAHEGEFLSMFLKISPSGRHFGFEPIPYLYESLQRQFNKYSNCKIYNYALSNSEGMTSFNHVISNPAYSGIKKRVYDRKNEKDETIQVLQKKLDQVIPADIKIDFIKIDVEGGEYNVMAGSTTLLKKYHPLIIFEFGIGGSDIYGTTPEKMYDFLFELGYSIALLDDFIKKNKYLSREGFIEQFYEKENYYFIANPYKQ